MEKSSTEAALSAYVFYVVKCLIGTAACYALYRSFPDYPFNWSIVSVLLVLDPDEKESMKLARNRMTANVIGAAVGFLFMLVFQIVNLPLLCLAVAATLGICRLVNLGKATRTALAALAIVMVSGHPTWHRGLDRMVCVIAGCLAGVAITAAGGMVRKAARHGRPLE